jgi:hypothetical protein
MHNMTICICSDSKAAFFFFLIINKCFIFYLFLNIYNTFDKIVVGSNLIYNFV